MIGMLVYLLVVLAIIGIAFYVVGLIPAPAPIRVAMQIVVGVIAILLLLGMLGIVPGLRFYHPIR